MKRLAVWLVTLLAMVTLVGPGVYGAAKPQLRGVQLFDAVWETVRDSYADPDMRGVDWEAVRSELRPLAEKAKDDAAVEEIVHQMLARLQDPFTFYVTPAEVAKAKRERAATDRLDIVGVGILLGQTPGGEIFAREVLPKGPAAKAGILPGARIAAIDGRPVKGEPVAGVAERIRGEKGTKVSLRILAPDGSARDVTLSRAPVSFTAQVRSEVLPGNIGYLYIPGDGDGLENQVLARLRKLHRTNGLIIDLRSGWSTVDLSHMTPMLKIAGLFTDQPLGGLIARQGAFVLMPMSSWPAGDDKSWLQSLLTPPPTAMDVYKKPIVCLVDDTTTWGIFALGLQETGRATVVGRPTAPGQGALASGVELVNGGGLSITATLYSSPRGNTLGHGMKPDVEVPLDLSFLAAMYKGGDADVEKARELLLAKVGKNAAK